MKYLVLSLLVATFLFSCKDDEQATTSTPPIEEELNLLPLAVGNYWVYQVVKIDTLGNEEILPEYDTVSVVGSTLINDEVYFTLEESNFPGLHSNTTTSHVRDSSGFIVDVKGEIFLSTSIFDEIIYTNEFNIGKLDYTMLSIPQTINVPNGDFECLNYEGLITDFSGIKDSRTIFNLYSEDVGLVSSNIFFFSSKNFMWERRLIDFSLN